MDEGGGTPTPYGPPDRATRLAFYRRRHRTQLRARRQTAAALGVAGGIGVRAVVLLVAGPPPLLGILIAIVCGLVIGIAVHRLLIAHYDREQTADRAFPDLPSFDNLVFHWSQPHDVAELDAALDEPVSVANHWTDQDRADVLLTPYLPGVVAGSLSWVVRDRGTGELVGGCACGDDPLEAGVVSIGMWLAPSQRGRGRGVEVLERAAPTVLVVLRATGDPIRGQSDQVTLSTETDNEAMRRIAERAGGVEVGPYVHALPDGSTATMVRYRFRPEAPGPAGDPGRPLAASGAWWHRIALVGAAIALIALVLLGEHSAQHRNDDRTGLAETAATAAADAQLRATVGDDLFVDPRILAGTSPFDGVDGPDEPVTTTAPLTRAESLLDQGTAGDVVYTVTWTRDSQDVDVTLTMRTPTAPPVSTSLSSFEVGGEVTAKKVPLGHGSYLLALVPAGTTQVRYQPDGGDASTVPTIDLVHRNGPPGSPLAVATAVPDRSSRWTITAIDGRGLELELRTG